MKVYKWILAMILVVAIAICLFLFGNFKSDDSSLQQNPNVQTTQQQNEPDVTEFTFTKEAFNERMLTLISAYRANNDLPAWADDDTIHAAAGIRALECAQMESKSHNRPDGSAWYTALGLAEDDSNQNYCELVGISGQSPEDLLRVWIGTDSINQQLLSGNYVSCGIGCEAVGNKVYTTLILYMP